MLNERAISIATRYWASHLGCSPEELFSSPLRVVLHHGELAGFSGAFALFRGGGATASIPPKQVGKLRPILSGLSGNPSPESFASALADVSTAVIGPAYIGYASHLTLPSHPARTLDLNDAAALDGLRRACDETEWEHGGSPVGHPASGVFVGNELVALAGYEVWDGCIAHISIITHPDFRGRGFGRCAVAHLMECAIRAGLLPQYRTLESNQASIRIAESLGFESYARSTSVRLSGNA